MKTEHGTIKLAGPLMRLWLRVLGGKTGFAAPWGVAYILPRLADGRRLIAHEDCHLRQLSEMGWVAYSWAHIKYNATMGYDENPLEVQARQYAAKNWHKYKPLV